MRPNWPLDTIHVFLCARVSMCVRPCRRTVPNVEQFERVEQHPFLHVVINLLIGPKARSPIDLPERRGEKHSKKFWGFFSHFISFFFFFSFFSIQQIEMLGDYRSGFRASLEKKRKKKEIPSHKKERKEERREVIGMGRERFSLSRTLWNF